MTLRNLHILLTVLGASGIAALFLNFVANVSPMDAIIMRDPYWKLAFPFFLSVPILVASMRWIVSGTLSRPERIIWFILSLASAVVTLNRYSGIDLDDEWPTRTIEWIVVVTPGGVLLLGALFLFLGSRTGRIQSYRAIMALQTAYLANALFCLIGFGSDGWSDLQVGAWLVLLTVIAYLLQIILALGRSGSRAGTAAGSS